MPQIQTRQMDLYLLPQEAAASVGAGFSPVEEDQIGQSTSYQLLQNPSSYALSSSESATPSASSIVGGVVPQKAPKPPISWWWWWEIGAGLLSIICMVLLLATLLKANNLALASWNLWIQPNSLVAVFTTVGKSAMMVPIASCIGQLKWRHFLLRPNRLSHLQVIDEASRGPWGSLMVLLNVRVRALTIWSLAVVSIVALGYDPSAQQILSFPVRDTKLNNVTAEIGTATQYWSKAYLQDLDGSTGSFDYATQFNNDLFKLESSIIDGISGSIFQPMYSCPGDRCQWDTFTTLGVCSEHQNVTDRVKVKCTGRTDDVLNCTYTFPSDPPVQPYAAEPFIMQFAQQEGPASHSTTLFQSTGYIGIENISDGTLGYGAVLYTSKVTDREVGDLKTPPAADLSYTAWYWCAQTVHNLTANRHAIAAAPTAYERLSYNGTSQDITGSLESLITYIAPSTGALYNVDLNADGSLFDYISGLLTRKIVDAHPHAGTTFDSDSLDLSMFLYTSDIGNVADDLASTLTNQLRSVNPGDNTNATIFSGDVYDEETYISVNWYWLMLPMAETLLVVVLLGVSMVLTAGEPLLKTSLIALLVHGLDGWTKEDVAIEGREDEHKLEHLAEHMNARLRDDGDGGFRFVRVW
ncbi:hypothetical protein VM1G_07622 [Cytospora mali]|uniref:Uncharacterized protein n=1 Tax=Cytospora mali TaxID=578113 RepID=A0A194W8T2_CYTMA|nr:hypothetical protein VM1G_07622 [Valsa mali]